MKRKTAEFDLSPSQVTNQQNGGHLYKIMDSDFTICKDGRIFTKDEYFEAKQEPLPASLLACIQALSFYHTCSSNIERAAVISREPWAVMYETDNDDTFIFSKRPMRELEKFASQGKWADRHLYKFESEDDFRHLFQTETAELAKYIYSPEIYNLFFNGDGGRA